MSILPQIEQQLVRAAENRARRPIARMYASACRPPRQVRPPRPGRSLTRLRVVLLAFVLLLATATITLAATGVILAGAPVRPEGQLVPRVGEGVPVPGASRLLALRVPDPEGGPPWGMRTVSTTRGEVCVQIGRVEDGQLGELGIDGVFHDDGRFHPMSPDVLPETTRVGESMGDDDASASVSCHLAGQVIVSVHRGVDRSAGAANGHEGANSPSDLRDIYYGILGAPAVSVSYRAGAAEHTVPVLQPLGAYLIVRRAASGEQVGYGNEALGSEGDLSPSPPLTTITYRLDSKLCQRGSVDAPGVSNQLVDPCPWPRWPTSRYAPPRDLRQPIHVRLQVSHHLMVGVQLSFTAPFAVTSARENYEIRIRGISCVPTDSQRHGAEVGWSGSGVSLGRDLARSTTVTHSFPASALFTGVCGFRKHLRRVSRRSATIDVLYKPARGALVLVGSATIKEPPSVSLRRRPRSW